MRKRRFSERLLAFLLAMLMAFSMSWGSSDMPTAYASEIGGDAGGGEGGSGENNPGEANPSPEVSYSVTVTAPATEIKAGETSGAFTAVVKKNNMDILDATVTWKLNVDSSVATISEDGRIKVAPNLNTDTQIIVYADYTYTDVNSQSQTATGQVTVTAKAKVTYTVSVTTPEGYFYPESNNDSFTCTVTASDGSSVTSPNITWSCTSGATIDASGKLSVDGNITSNKPITVTATYTSSTGETYTGTAEITAYKLATLSGTIVDSFDSTGIVGATIKVTLLDAGEEKTATTSNGGSFTVSVFEGLDYTLTVTKDGYKEYSATVNSTDWASGSIALDIIGTLTVSGTGTLQVNGQPSVLTADDGNAELGQVIWKLSDDSPADVIELKSTGQNTATVTPLKSGTVTVLASAHGIEAQPFSITVNRDSVKGSHSIYRGDTQLYVAGEGEDFTEEDYANPSDPLTFYVSFVSDTVPETAVKQGDVTWKLTLNDEKNTVIASGTQSISTVENHGYAAAIQVNNENKGLPQAGSYTFEYSLSETDDGLYAKSSTYTYIFEVKEKSGQTIDAIESDQFSNIIYDGKDTKYTFNFTATVHGENEEQVKNIENWSVLENWSSDGKDAWIEDGVITAEAIGDKEDFYKVFGTVTYYASKKMDSDAKIIITYSHSNSNGIKVYSDVTASTDGFTILPKPLNVNKVSFNSKIYNGSNSADVTEIVLDGIASIDQGKVEAVKDGLVFNTPEAGTVYLDTSENPITLSGEAADNYIVNQPGVNAFTWTIDCRTITVSIPNVIPIGYYDNQLADNTGKGELYNYIVGQIGENEIFGNFVGDENKEQKLSKEIRTSYMPAFKVIDANGDLVNQFSGTGKYTIIAIEPESNITKPDAMKNYQFDFSGNANVGTFEIVNSDISRNVHYTISGSNVYVAPDAQGNPQSGTIWIMPNTSLEISSANINIYTEADPSVVKAGEADGQFEFVLKKDNTQSNTKIESYCTDGTAPEAVITVSELETEDKSFTDQLLSAITFGVFAREQSSFSLTYSDNQSGIKSAEYVIVDVDTYEAGVSGQDADAVIDFLSSLGGWKKYTNAEKFNTEANIIICARVEDNVGNITYLTSDGVVVDDTEPSLVALSIAGDDQTGIYNHDVVINVAVDNNTKIYSGIDSISAEVYVNDNKVEGAIAESGYKGAEGNRTAQELAGDANADYAFTISADKCNVKKDSGDSNNVKVSVYVTDRSGNVTQKDIYFVIDLNTPDVDVKFDTEPVNVYNGVSYFNTLRTATITVTEANFDPSRVDVSLNNAQYVTTSGEWKHEGSVHTKQYYFDGSEDYTFNVEMTDLAGNSGAMKENVPDHYRAFTVDQTEPEVLSVKYYMYVDKNTLEISPGKAEQERYYGNDRIYSVITLKEHNFIGADAENGKVGGLELAITANNRGENYTDPAYQWISSQGDIHTLRVDYNSDANYNFDMQYTDLASNTLSQEYAAEYFTVDTALPTAKIRLDNIGGIWSEFVEIISFGLFSNESQTVTIFDEKDTTSGVQFVEYYKSHNECTVSQLDNVSWTAGKSLTITANERCVVYGKITDRSGNYTYISTNGFVVDDRIDKPIISIVTPEPLNHIYNGPVDVQITVEDPDPTGNDDLSGLRSVYYEIRSNGSVTKSGNLAVEAGQVRQKVASETVRIDATDANDTNNVEVYVEAYDNAGNRSELTSEPIAIDITRPEISVTFDNNSPLNGQYYQNTRTATVTVRERNFDPNNVQINITNTDGTRPTVTGWSSSSNAGLSNDATHTCQIIFAADGDYTFTVNCTDLALNPAVTPYQSDEFTIDKTLPTVNVTYSNNDALNGHFYNESRTATVTITEHNFRASDARATITAALNGAGISAPSISGWSTSGDRHTATVSFNSDGDYTFDIAYTDLAGNAMADYAQDSFTVDLTNPEIEITGVENRSANKGTVAPVITLTDTNYTANGVTLTLTGADKGRINVDAMVSRSAVTNGQTITFRNFGENMDDIYTLTAKLVDQAGNETTRSITFSVNRDGSTYKLNDYTAQLVQSGFTNSPKDIVIQEVNVDTLEFIEITYTKDGEVVTLKEGVDYTVEEEGGDGQWKVYTYTIKASCFEEEGQYSINIYSEDRAKNTSTYQAKNSKLEEEKQMTLEFVVDKTAPSVSIANLEDRGRYRENVHEFTLSVKDNMLLSYVELYLDGVLYHTYSGDELTVEDGVLTIPVDSKNAYQTVKIIAYDAAGNPTDPVEYQVLVTSNWWIQFYMNKPLFFGCIAGIVVIAGVIIFLVVKRSKKDNKNYKKI